MSSREERDDTMCGGDRSSPGNPRPAFDANEGSSTRRRRPGKYASKACLACRTAKTKCDSGQPRCSLCEVRDVVCDYSWQQKRRGPQVDPLSSRTERKHRHVEQRTHSSSQSTYLRHFTPTSRDSDSPASSDSTSSPPRNTPLPMNATTDILGKLLSLGSVPHQHPVPSTEGLFVGPPQVYSAPVLNPRLPGGLQLQPAGIPRQNTFTVKTEHWALFKFDRVVSDNRGSEDIPKRGSQVIDSTATTNFAYYPTSAPFTSNFSRLNGFTFGATLPQHLAPTTTHVNPSLSSIMGHLPARLPRQLSLFEDLPPLPSSEVMNEMVFQVFQDAQAGDNLFPFLIIHKPTFFARVRSGTLEPILLLSVLCLGCRKHPARDVLRPLFSKRVARYLKWNTETVLKGTLSLATFQSLMMWTLFVIVDLGHHATSGQTWLNFTLSVAKAMRMDLEVDPSVKMDWIEREERRRGWWWCWYMSSINAVGFRSQPRIPEMQPTILLPCAETYFNLDPPPSGAPVNLPGWIVQADPPLFMDSSQVTSDVTKDHMWLLFAGVAKQSRTILRLSSSVDPLARKMEFETHTAVSAKLLSMFPPAVHLLTLEELYPDPINVYHGWFDECRHLPSSLPYQVAVMAIMVYSNWLIPMGPQTKNMLEDTAWVGSETFVPCMELANACTRLISALLSAVPTFPLPGTTAIFHIFHVGAIHLLCLKHALSKVQKAETGTSNPGVPGSDGITGQGMQLYEVSNGIGTTSWTSDHALNTVIMDALEKAEVHGRVLRIHALETKMGEGVWNMWESMVKNVFPVVSALGMALQLTERIVEVDLEE
ncbi:hypothetical protein M427DRAFT_56382 [Gonapodya prolifera JEL478]|uniref:Zn(2)-C6 fungal-type domain-containing protein n=1 Tax=Gonapodya prolifera (strain JEL478) TaxID=1344416 RepID=A0A139AGD1_GONPJ|nr:hypothetical protein M427DRAFT_56382 [Gonapodya prolifera JEL478]|eukprot:KXS15810.1 hypothetical protein M427DRAFT_56382 [Gonapodya prolifera JEL478]